MSTNNALSQDMVAVVAACSAVGGVLVCVIVISCIVCIRYQYQKKKVERRNRYMVGDVPTYSSSQNPADPLSSNYGSWYHDPYQQRRWTSEKQLTSAEVAPHTTGAFPTKMKNGISLISLPATRQVPHHYMSADQLNKSFYASLYDKLKDSTLEQQGRPLYVCKRPDYFQISNYFDIVGKTRFNDWLVKPKVGVPNRKNASRKIAPKRPSPKSSKLNGFAHTRELNEQSRFPKSNVMYTPFGAVDRVPTKYLSGSNLDKVHKSNPLFDQQTRQTTSLPRQSASLPREPRALSSGERRKSDKTMLQANNADDSTLDRSTFASVVKKHTLNKKDKSDALAKQSNGRAPINVISNASPKNSKYHRHVGKPGEAEVSGRDRSGSTSTQKSLGITEHFKFLEQYDAGEDIRF